jgi:hypothetical protein
MIIILIIMSIPRKLSIIINESMIPLSAASHRGLLSHPVSEGKPNANYVRARIRVHVHSDYINEHHRIVLE